MVAASEVLVCVGFLMQYVATDFAIPEFIPEYSVPGSLIGLTMVQGIHVDAGSSFVSKVLARLDYHIIPYLVDFQDPRTFPRDLLATTSFGLIKARIYWDVCFDHGHPCLLLVPRSGHIRMIAVDLCARPSLVNPQMWLEEYLGEVHIGGPLLWGCF